MALCLGGKDSLGSQN